MNSLERFFISKGIGTFRGWILRYALKLATGASASITTYLVTKQTQLEQIASLNGVSADTLAHIHAQSSDVITTVAAFVSTVILASAEAAMSRAAAKVAESPIIPAAIPIDKP